jgi:hypothetical protein
VSEHYSPGMLPGAVAVSRIQTLQAEIDAHPKMSLTGSDVAAFAPIACFGTRRKVSGLRRRSANASFGHQ